MFRREKIDKKLTQNHWYSLRYSPLNIPGSRFAVKRNKVTLVQSQFFKPVTQCTETHAQ